MPEIIPHNRLTFGEAECARVLRTVRSGQWAQGSQVQELEAVLARMAGVEHAVCVASGFAALRLALGALGVRPGDSVLVPAYSCVALANATLSWGATPVAVDVDATEWNLAPAQCRRQLPESRTCAVIAVNTFGAAAPVEEILPMGLPVIEDCAHAFGTKVDGKWLGSRTSVAVLSFYATKLIGGGEGGAVLTNLSEIADFVRESRDYGDQPPDAHRMNDKMNDLEASLALAQLERLPEMIAARETIAQRYFDRLGGLAIEYHFRLPKSSRGRVWYRFVVEMLDSSARAAIDRLQQCGVHAAEPVKDWRPADTPSTPVADRAYRSLVSLPIYPSLTKNEQNAVVEAVLKISKGHIHV